MLGGKEIEIYARSNRVRRCPPWVSGSRADSCTPARWSSPSPGRCCHSSGLWQGSRRDPHREPAPAGSKKFKKALVYWYHQVYKGHQINKQIIITSQLLRLKSWLYSANKIRVAFLFVFQDRMNCSPPKQFPPAYNGCSVPEEQFYSR